MWKKSTEKHAARLQEKIRELLAVIERANADEDALYGDRDLEELGDGQPVTAEKIDATVRRLEERLAGKKPSREVRKVVRTLRRDVCPVSRDSRSSWRRSAPGGAFRRRIRTPPSCG